MSIRQPIMKRHKIGQKRRRNPSTVISRNTRKIIEKSFGA